MNDMNQGSTAVSNVVKQFDRVYLGDALVQRIEIDLVEHGIAISCSRALVLRSDPGADMFDPAERYEPATLVFQDVRSLVCPEGSFFMNATIVDYDARPSPDDGYVEFRLELTGGFDNATFMRTLVIVARNFSLGTAS
jgi:hypothetical protein